MPQETLPAGLTVRSPRLDDDRDIFALVSAYNHSIVGIADFTLDDVRDELNEPGFVRETDGWVVHDGDRLVGYATTFRRADSDRIDADVVAPDSGVAGWLLDRTIERARAIGRESEYRGVTVDHSTYRDDDALQRLLTERAFGAATSFYRMRVDHTGPVQDPAMPAGVLLRSAAEGESVRRTAHAVREAAFTEHFGEVAQTYDDWVVSLESKAMFSWGHVRLAEADGEPAGMIRVSDQFIEDECCGYVAQIGVAPWARGRGIAKTLLREAFAADAARGLIGTLLHVDSGNTTPALGLYESVGMRPVLVIDAWRAEITP